MANPTDKGRGGGVEAGKTCRFSGCKESQFYSLPFGQTVASMY